MSEHGYEKTEYTVFEIPEEIEGSEWKWCYSAKALQQELQCRFNGRTLLGVYVELDGYLESEHHNTDYIDLSFEGGGCIVVFDNAVLELGLHVSGQFIYRIVPVDVVKMRSVNGYPPYDCIEMADCYLDIQNHDITVKISGRTVTDMRVIGTDLWSFRMDGFDIEKANAAKSKNDLPGEIDICTDAYTVRLIGDDMEYYFVAIEKSGNCRSHI